MASDRASSPSDEDAAAADGTPVAAAPGPSAGRHPRHDGHDARRDERQQEAAGTATTSFMSCLRDHVPGQSEYASFIHRRYRATRFVALVPRTCVRLLSPPRSDSRHSPGFLLFCTYAHCPVAGRPVRIPRRREGWRGGGGTTA